MKLVTIMYRMRGIDGSNEIYCVNDRETVFSIAWVLSKSPSIIEFSVVLYGVKVSPINFGFGQIDKWVESFSWLKEE